MPTDPRWIRRMILKALYAQHPEWMSDQLLRFSLDNLGCPVSGETMSSELVYLRDYPDKNDGYVELRAEHVAGSNEERFESRITPDGINLVEKLSPPDPAIARE